MADNPTASDRVSQDMFEMLTSILGLDAGATFDVDKPFESIGIDSLLAMDLVAALEEKYAIKLPETVLADYPTIHDLAGHVASRAGK